jgi:hypothetical protein
VGPRLLERPLRSDQKHEPSRPKDCGGTRFEGMGHAAGELAALIGYLDSIVQLHTATYRRQVALRRHGEA